MLPNIPGFVRATVDGSPFPAWVTTPRGDVVHANAVALEVFDGLAARDFARSVAAAGSEIEIDHPRLGALSFSLIIDDARRDLGLVSVFFSPIDGVTARLVIAAGRDAPESYIRSGTDGQ